MFKFITRLFTKKSNHVLSERDLKKLKEIATQIKFDIGHEQNADPYQDETPIYKALYGALYSVGQCIEQIESQRGKKF